MKNQVDRSLRNAKARCCSGGLFVLRLSSANALLKRWAKRAARDRNWAQKAWTIGGQLNNYLGYQYAHEAQTVEHCIEDFRRLTGGAVKRQPQHNSDSGNDSR